MPTVTVSSVIDVPASEVWAVIRDFNGLPSWHPRMVESHIEGDMQSNQIGCVRNFEVASGARLREKLLPMSTIPSLIRSSKHRPRSAIIRQPCASSQ
jgi:hypothetical protein